MTIEKSYSGWPPEGTTAPSPFNLSKIVSYLIGNPVTVLVASS